MQCGLIYEIQIPQPQYPGSEQERYKTDLRSTRVDIGPASERTGWQTVPENWPNVGRSISSSL